MAKLRGATLGLLGGITATIALGGLTGVGCGGDNTTNPGTDGGSSSSSGGTGSSSSSGGRSSSGSSSSGASSGSSSGASSSSGGSSSSGSGSGSGSSSSGGMPDSGKDADTGTTVPDASEGGGVCTTTIAVLAPPAADAGAPEAGEEAGAEGGSEASTPPAPALLFGFDNGGDLGWGGGQGANSTISLGASLSDGHTCPGALSMYVTYSAYGAADSTTYNYNGNPPYMAANWTGHTKLHLWVKVLTSDFSTLVAVQPFVQSNNFGPGDYRGTYTAIGATLSDGGKLSDGGWHEIVVDLTPAQVDGGNGNYVPSIVNQFGVQLAAQSAAADGGPAVPPPATVLVDDIWLE